MIRSIDGSAHLHLRTVLGEQDVMTDLRFTPKGADPGGAPVADEIGDGRIPARPASAELAPQR
jgi:hypothetical protein